MHPNKSGSIISPTTKRRSSFQWPLVSVAWPSESNNFHRPKHETSFGMFVQPSNTVGQKPGKEKIIGVQQSKEFPSDLLKATIEVPCLVS